MMKLLAVLSVLILCHYILGAGVTLESLRDEDINVENGYASVSDKMYITNSSTTQTVGLFAFNLTGLTTTNFKMAYYRFTQLSTYSCEVGMSCRATLVLIPFYNSWYEGENFAGRTNLVSSVDLNDTSSYAQTLLSSQGSSLVVDVTKLLNQMIARNNGVIPAEGSFAAFIVSGRGTFTVPSRRSRPGETFLFIDTTPTEAPTTTVPVETTTTTAAPNTTVPDTENPATTTTTTTTAFPTTTTAAPTTTVAATTTTAAVTTTTTTTTTAIPPTTTTRVPITTTTTTTRAPTPVNCWTCGAGFMHWYDQGSGYTASPNGDRCACVLIPGSNPTNAPPASTPTTSTNAPAGSTPVTSSNAPASSTTGSPTTTGAPTQPARTNGSATLRASIVQMLLIASCIILMY